MGNTGSSTLEELIFHDVRMSKKIEDVFNTKKLFLPGDLVKIVCFYLLGADEEYVRCNVKKSYFYQDDNGELLVKKDALVDEDENGVMFEIAFKKCNINAKHFVPVIKLRQGTAVDLKWKRQVSNDTQMYHVTIDPEAKFFHAKQRQIRDMKLDEKVLIVECEVFTNDGVLYLNSNTEIINTKKARSVAFWTTGRESMQNLFLVWKRLDDECREQFLISGRPLNTKDIVTWLSELKSDDDLDFKKIVVVNDGYDNLKAWNLSHYCCEKRFYVRSPHRAIHTHSHHHPSRLQHCRNACRCFVSQMLGRLGSRHYRR